MTMSDIPDRLRRWPIDPDPEPACDLMDQAANEIDRLRAEVAVLKQSAAKLHDIAASGADPTKRRRMLDQMAEESFAEDG